MRIRLLTLLALCVGLAVSVSACRFVVDTNQTGGAATGVSPDSQLHHVLALMPDNGASRRYLRVVNNGQLAKYLDLPRPPEDAPKAELDAWYNKMSDAMGQALTPEGTTLITSTNEWVGGLNTNHPRQASADTQAGLGFDVRSIDVTALTGEAEDNPAPIAELVIGAISAADAQAALDACTTCPSHETVQYGGVDYYSWGDDFESNLDNAMVPPAFDQLGRGGRLRIADGHAYRTLTTGEMQSAIGVETRLAPSLLDDQDWRFAADLLSRYGLILVTAGTENVDQADAPKLSPIYEAMTDGDAPLADDVRQWLETYPDTAARITASSPDLPDFSLAVTGITGGDNGLEVVMALVFDDAVSANEAANALQQRAQSGLRDGKGNGLVNWSDSIVSSEFQAVGRAVVGHIVPSTDDQGRSLFAPFVVAPVPGVQFLGGAQPEIGPTAEFLLH